MKLAIKHRDITGMDVVELFDLSNWYREHGTKTSKLYQTLLTTLQHNATQNQKMPVRDALEGLVEGLLELPLTELNLQQLAHLEHLGIAELLGAQGAVFVKRVVTQSNYDPATSASEIKAAADKINGTLKTFQALSNSLSAAGFKAEDSDSEVGKGTAIARIQFRHEASIDNIAELKKWSSDWNDIVRGIGHLVGENPHDMKVIGASKGSIIVCVAGTIPLLTVFALMSKKVADIVLEGLKVANAIEDLRHKKISNQIIEKSMKADLEAKQAALEDETIAALKQHATDSFKQEHDAHLATAVKKFINFSKKGGEVDYLQPPSAEDNPVEDEGDAHEGAELLVDELRDLISEIRSVKSQTLLLEGTPAEAAE